MIPKQIGRYQIKAELGRGGMSTVYWAHDPHFERDVAVKLLSHELLHHPTFRMRFEREAKAIAAIDHPAIVPVYDFGQEDRQPFLVMRFMTGGSLAEKLAKGPLAIPEATRIITRLATALDEAHAHGIIHRDLKPSNILFDQRDEPFISDFGIAKLTEARTKITETGGMVGTPAYMSPEQIQGTLELDGRSDIYAMGVLLFEMLTGEHPYHTTTPIGMAVKHVFEPVPRLLDMHPNLPGEWQGVIARAMAKNRHERYQTTADLAEAVTILANNTTLPNILGTSPSVAGKRYALLIGNNAYEDEVLAQLIKPALDIHDLARVLEDKQIGRFDEVTVLFNESTNHVRRTISHFFAHKQPDDLLLLYFAGHAALDERNHLYLAVKNTEHHLLRGTAISAALISDEMSSSQSKKQIFILDCYYSCAATTHLPTSIGKAVNAGISLGRHKRTRFILNASNTTQYIWGEGKIIGQAQPSHFTRSLIEGLETGAADSNQNGEITLNDLFDYACKQLEAQAQPRPHKWVHNEKQEVVIGYSAAAAAEKPDLPASPPPRTGGSYVVEALNNILITPVPDQKAMARQVNARLSQAGATKRPFLTRTRLGWASTFVLLTLLLTGSGSRLLQAVKATPQIAAAIAPNPTPNPTTTTAPTLTDTPPPTQPPTPAPSPTASTTPPPSPTAALSPTLTLTLPVAVAAISSSLFTQPEVTSTELTFVDEGDVVTILGRSEQGQWLYVRTEDEQEGYTFAPRFTWSGEFSQLPVIPLPETTTTAVSPTCGSQCPPLSIDLYPLENGRCENDIIYKTLFISGQGGDGTYQYFWNDTAVNTQFSQTGIGFEVNNARGPVVIGTGKVVSGDGQTAEKELFVSGFTCDN